MFWRILIAIAFVSSLVIAQENGPQTAPNFALTVYSTADPATFDPQELARQQVLSGNPAANPLPGYGVVREIRKLNLAAGENTIRFTDVAAGIDPTTVAFESTTSPMSTSVLEQNYEYDLVNFDALLSKFINREITITRNGRTFPATLLSSDPSSIIYREGSSSDGPVQVMSRDPGAIQLPDTRGLNTKPTLVWKISTTQPGAHDARVTYQTSGLTWRADYNVLLNSDDSKSDIGAWVTLLNQSGASYPNARLKLVAGDVQRVAPPQRVYYGGRAGRGGGGGGGGGFVETPFFEYHLYTLGRATSINNNSTKQIEMFPARTEVPIKKTYVYYGLPASGIYYSTTPNSSRDIGIAMNKKVDVYFQMQNSQANGMGIPLPAGRVRVYKQDDADKSIEFIGEDVIQHTPKDEPVRIRLGSAFDIVGERIQTDFTVNSRQNVITESFEIKLRNHKTEPVTVIIKENLYRWVNWEITASSDKYEKQDSRTIHIPVEVAPDSEKKVTYTVRYTW